MRRRCIKRTWSLQHTGESTGGDSFNPRGGAAQARRGARPAAAGGDSPPGYLVLLLRRLERPAAGTATALPCADSAAGPRLGDAMLKGGTAMAARLDDGVSSPGDHGASSSAPPWLVRRGRSRELLLRFCRATGQGKGGDQEGVRAGCPSRANVALRPDAPTPRRPAVPSRQAPLAPRLTKADVLEDRRASWLGVASEVSACIPCGRSPCSS